MNAPRVTTADTLILIAVALCAIGVPIVGAYPGWIPTALGASAATAALVVPLLLQVAVVVWRVKEQRHGVTISARQNQNEALAILVSWIVVGIWRLELGEAAFAWAAPLGLWRWSRVVGLAALLAWGIAARKSMAATTTPASRGVRSA